MKHRSKISRSRHVSAYKVIGYIYFLIGSTNIDYKFQEQLAQKDEALEEYRGIIGDFQKCLNEERSQFRESKDKEETTSESDLKLKQLKNSTELLNGLENKLLEEAERRIHLLEREMRKLEEENSELRQANEILMIKRETKNVGLQVISEIKLLIHLNEQSGEYGDVQRRTKKFEYKIIGT